MGALCAGREAARLALKMHLGPVRSERGRGPVAGAQNRPRCYSFSTGALNFIQRCFLAGHRDFFHLFSNAGLDSFCIHSAARKGEEMCIKSTVCA